MLKRFPLDNALLLQALNASQPGYSATATMDGAAWVALAATLLVAGCASPTHRAPVEDRKPAGKPVAGSVVPAAAPSAPAAADATPPKPLPGAENAGKPGYSATATMDGEAGWAAYTDVLHELAKVGLITQQDVDRLLQS